MPAEFAALPPNVPDSDALLITHFKQVAEGLFVKGENLRAQYYTDYARAIAAGQPVVHGVAVGSGDARVTMQEEQLSDGVTVTNLRAQALNTRPRSEILEQPPAFARVERSAIHQSEAARTFASRVASDRRPVIAREPVERIGPVKVPSLVGRALAAVGIVGRVTAGYQSHGEYDLAREETLGAMAAGVARAAQQQVQPRSEELAGDSAFQNGVEVAVERIVEVAEVNRQSLMLEFMENPDRGIPDWVRSGGPTNLNREER